MHDPVIDRIVRDIRSQDAALVQYRRAAQTMDTQRQWAAKDGWDDEYERTDRLLGHLRAEIREMEAPQ